MAKQRDTAVALGCADEQRGAGTLAGCRELRQQRLEIQEERRQLEEQRQQCQR
jgi:hypothetical protein